METDKLDLSGITFSKEFNVPMTPTKKGQKFKTKTGEVLTVDFFYCGDYMRYDNLSACKAAADLIGAKYIMISILETSGMVSIDNATLIQ